METEGPPSRSHLILEFSGEISFNYTLTDDKETVEQEVEVSGKIIVDVLPANDPPVAVDDRRSVMEDSELRIDPGDVGGKR